MLMSEILKNVDNEFIYKAITWAVVAMTKPFLNIFKKKQPKGETGGSFKSNSEGKEFFIDLKNGLFSYKSYKDQS